MKKAKIKEKVNQNEPFNDIEYEIMLINRHFQKPEDIRIAYESDYWSVQRHKSLMKQHVSQIALFFKESDDNNNGVFDFDEFKIFMEKK